MRISELAERVGVPTSTVRYYERAGLLAQPVRTSSGYRDYDEDDAARLLFVARARRMGLAVEQIGDLLPVWDGTNCAGARERVGALVESKQREIRARIAELKQFAAQLATVTATLDDGPGPAACRADLSCCVPDSGPVAITLEMGLRSRAPAD